MSVEASGLDWSNKRALPAFQAPLHIDIYDIRGLPRERQLTVTTMVGIINRPQPKIYLIASDDDLFWLRRVLDSIPQNVLPFHHNQTIENLLLTYRQNFQGLIIYDPKLIDTVNIATILAGQSDGLVVSPAQVPDLQITFDLPIIADLRSFRWHNRLQAYHWALQNLHHGASARLIAGLNPNTVTGLRSFLVATRTFIYWLDSRVYLPDWSDGWISERHLMQQIFSTYQPGVAHLGWFIDESSGVRLTSQAAMTVLATDHFVNLEVWTATQLQSTIHSTQVQEAPSAKDKFYVSFTLSDGDNLQYNQHHMLHIWRDRHRGSLPIGWTISPVLMQAAPAIAEYYMNTATANDELIAGPSGAGYMFPSHWPAEHIEPFLQRTGQLMQAMGMTTLQVLDTDPWESSGVLLLSAIRHTGMTFTDHSRQQSYARVLASFGLQAILSGAGQRTVKAIRVEDIPLYHNLGLAGRVKQTIKIIRSATIANLQRPLFLNVYILAWSMTPTDLQQVKHQLGHEYEFVLPRTLLAMLRKTL